MADLSAQITVTPSVSASLSSSQSLQTNIVRSTNYDVKISDTNGVLQTGAPLSLKNMPGFEFNNIEDVENVVVVNRADGSSLVYNSLTGNYEVKLAELDGGSF